jgi:hypothetical protein
MLNTYPRSMLITVYSDVKWGITLAILAILTVA